MLITNAAHSGREELDEMSPQARALEKGTFFPSCGVGTFRFHISRQKKSQNVTSQPASHLCSILRWQINMVATMQIRVIDSIPNSTLHPSVAWSPLAVRSKLRCAGCRLFVYIRLRGFRSFPSAHSQRAEISNPSLHR